MVIVRSRVEWHPSLDPPCVDVFSVADSRSKANRSNCCF
ncbi:hypothetical protein SynMINOS11_01692 [Synechococcus sp. Minos11]|nr:hypothetical protein SynMINOS11_01692 [Synechococcus sp. Minos11]